MLERWRENLGVKLLAVTLALILWLYVTSEQNPTTEHVVRIPLEVENLSAGLVVANLPSEVQIRLEGRKGQIKNLLPRDIRAYVDLRAARVGENTLPVQVTLPEGVRLVRVNPAQVTVKVEQVQEVSLPVQVNLNGEPAGGYRALDPILKPSQVIVSGPEALLKEIGKVYVEVKLDQARGNYLAQLPVQVVDREGHPLSRWLTLKPESVEVFVPVVQDMPSRMVAIRPRLVGEPAAGYQIKRVILHPEVVEVLAPYNVLATLDNLYTTPINIAGARKNIIVESQLEIPPGVQLSSFPRVRVIVEIERVG
ncbi:YbbR domain-containing protein [Thermanaeromonas toyohensis ToBE]|uniref:YbbR domain-containing protein n=1 Tax=Thermanaeromonas toyohensis ToBE TaxID=698762 RepID=A0A1W1VBH8_9FIRM|nr:CdaR family protein [Thermanaeromonas toyohensis]SMB90817.1 YbbR domain-containing protein [Thermanaeromonas toyohensis ToBE]